MPMAGAVLKNTTFVGLHSVHELSTCCSHGSQRLGELALRGEGPQLLCEEVPNLDHGVDAMIWELGL